MNNETEYNIGENISIEEWKEHRQERRSLRRKLFAIRDNLLEGRAFDSWIMRKDNGEVELEFDEAELVELKEFYENKHNFTGWKDFPLKWDIGDPKRVRNSSTVYPDSIEMIRAKILWGYGLDEIVNFGIQHWNDTQEVTKEVEKIKLEQEREEEAKLIKENEIKVLEERLSKLK